MTFSEPPTTPLKRALYRAPIWIFRLGLGPLLSRRFVLLTHKGRTTGRARQAVLEVVGHNEATGEVLVASGYGTRSQWYRNIKSEPRVLFQLGDERFRGTAVPLPPADSGQALAHYAQRRPDTAKTLLRSLGHETDGSLESYEKVGSDPENGIPIVRLMPAQAPGTHHPSGL